MTARREWRMLKCGLRRPGLRAFDEPGLRHNWYQHTQQGVYVGAGYFSRSAQIVFGDPKWWRKALILVVVGAVPLVGAVYKLGYEMVFLRDVAWGMQQGLPRFDDSGGKLKTGLLGFIVDFIWSLVLIPVLVAIVAVYVLISLPATSRHGAAPHPPTFPWWFSLIIWIPSAILGVWSSVAMLRTAIYTDTGAGLQVSQVVALTRRERPGFLKVTGLMLAVSAAALLLGILGQYAVSLPAIDLTLRPMASFAWVLLSSLVTTPAGLISFCAYGLWAQDTDPSTWPPLSQRRVESAA